eukprot:CAMPEP_0172211306 /NCGR_PEP_ID=MMETSP1050-20130122/36330_1 /TAXON_ID=233186 /ORGANISM="Cryptomonas curvata, Strain CCAP979/52" /LENGTH=313 /DNA_ID=CAMNT_0012891745 /DNA_START=287 /DNA_END=1224 /DNA_ORIENTATION=-
MSDLVSILSVITSAVILMGLRTQSQQQQRQLSVLWLSRFARNSLHIQIARSSDLPDFKSSSDCKRRTPGGLHDLLEPSFDMFALEDCPAPSAAAMLLQERDFRFVRRCGTQCEHYCLWRCGGRRKQNGLSIGSSCRAAKWLLEFAVSQSALALSIMLLIYCLLLEDPNRVDQELVSIPLLNAAESGHVEDVKLLLQHGADISQRNYYGLTALHRASEEGRTEVVRLLLDMGADMDATDADGETALQKAAQQGQRRVVHVLASYGPDLLYQDVAGYTLLMRAAEWGWRDIAGAVLQAKGGLGLLDLRDDWGESA